MKRFLVLIVLMLAGCGESEEAAKVDQHLETEDVFAQLSKDIVIFKEHGKLLNNLKLITDQQAEIIVDAYQTKHVHWDANFNPLGLPLNGLGSITNNQAETLGKVRYQPQKDEFCTLYLNGLKSINEEQAKGLSKAENLELNGLTSITDQQAKSLSRVEGYLHLNGLTSITDQQAESLSKVGTLSLNGLISITDEQAESLSKAEDLDLNGLSSITDQQAESLSKVGTLSLNGLTSITDAQAESLSKVEYVWISEDLQPLIDKYKNQ